MGMADNWKEYRTEKDEKSNKQFTNKLSRAEIIAILGIIIASVIAIVKYIL